MTYKPEYYIKGLNIHSVRDLFLPAKVSAALDLMMPDVSKKSFLLLCFIEAAFFKFLKSFKLQPIIVIFFHGSCKW